MPNNMELFWSIPSLVDAEGNERAFSYYYVHSKTGEVWSCKSNKYLSNKPNQIGYVAMTMMDDKGQKLQTNQHRIVLASKLQHWDFLEVEHQSKVRNDNLPSNLIAITRDKQFDQPCRGKMSVAKKGKRSNAAKLSDDMVREIRNGFKAWSGRRRDYVVKMTSELGVSENTIYLIIRNESYIDVV